MAGEAVISFAVEAVLTKLVSTVTKEAKLVGGLTGEIKTLGRKLNTILDLLKDAERKRIEGVSLNGWLLNLKNAAYDAEDVLDVYAFEMLSRKLEKQNRMMNKARNFFSLSNPILFRIKMAHKVKDVNLMLAGVVKEGIELGLNQALHRVSSSVHRQIPHTHSSFNGSIILGRETDTSKVKDMLLQSSSGDNLLVISIVGLAGLGKTTVAQLVYNEQSVKSHFDQTIWICVSNDFDVTRILKEMADCLNINIGQTSSNIDGLKQKLQEKLNGKKYLFVLDDVWNTDDTKWERLRSSLLGIGAAKESKILATTRSVTVASTMKTETGTFLTHHLSVLSDEDSWLVFRQRAFATGGANETPYLVEVGKRMVKKCGGVPLALKTLGALMQSKEEHEWASIEESSLWYADETGIMPALRLSFNHLPSPSIKQCFSYCSIFPKDFKFVKDDLIQLWIAQGFIPPSEESNMEMEDTGNDYFKILWWNSFFQDVKMDEDGKIETCKMHDLVHDLAQSLSKSECLVLDANSSNHNIEVRHLAIPATNTGIRLRIPKENAKKLRTFFSAGDEGGDVLMNSKFLHALKLKGYGIVELPTIIGKLKQLRYLDVSETIIKVFPAFIAKLYNLQTLRLTNFHDSVELFDQLNALINLRHLYFDSENMPVMPISMGRLTCLQTLPCFVVSKDKGRQIEELGALINLRGKLDIRNLQHVSGKEEAQKANLTKKTKVYKLELSWSGGEREGDNNDENVLEGLQPPPNLNSLAIKEFRGSKFPSWMMIANTSHNGNSFLPLSLVEIKLMNCTKCERIPTLGNLPFLKSLEISGMLNLKCIGTEFYSGYSSGDGDRRLAFFPSLQKLALENMPNLVEWKEVATTTEGAAAVFPCLEKLSICDCEQLQIVPRHFLSLRKLKIDGIKSGKPIVDISSKKTSTITHLDIKNVRELDFLPLENNKNLVEVEITECPMLTCISPNGLHTHVALEYLEIWSCPNLTSVPVIQGLTSLKSMCLVGCHGLTSLPIGLGSCTSLETLWVVDCVNLTSISEEEEDLSELSCSLVHLRIVGLTSLTSWPLDRFPHRLPKLKGLGIGGFGEELDSLPLNLNLNIDSFPQLEILRLYGWPKLKYLPDQLQHLTALTHLSLESFEGLEVLPDWLGNLSSLHALSLWFCKNLKYLPSVESMQRLTNLRNLWVDECPLLEERCNRGSGPEWSKISHIPYIEINGRRI